MKLIIALLDDLEHLLDHIFQKPKPKALRLQTHKKRKK